jgi:hypothetical protein
VAADTGAASGSGRFERITNFHRHSGLVCPRHSGLDPESRFLLLDSGSSPEWRDECVLEFLISPRKKEFRVKPGMAGRGAGISNRGLKLKSAAFYKRFTAIRRAKRD